MAKQITRTIITYDHMLVKMKEEEGLVSVDSAVNLNFSEKLGARKIADFIKENSQYEGYVLARVKPVETKYTMSLDDFIKYATKIEGNEKEEG